MIQRQETQHNNEPPDYQCEQCGSECRSHIVYDGKIFCTHHCKRDYMEERGRE